MPRKAPPPPVTSILPRSKITPPNSVTDIPSLGSVRTIPNGQKKSQKSLSLGNGLPPPPASSGSSVWQNAAGISAIKMVKSDPIQREKIERERNEKKQDLTPVTSEQEGGGAAPKVELTEEQREQLREKRRERRKKDKERKRMEQEEKKRLEIYAPKTSKLQFISPDMLNKVTNGVTAASKKKTTSSASSVIVGSAQKQPPDFGASEMPQDVANPDAASKKTTSIRFMDEEYPDLGTKVPPKRKEVVLRRTARDFKSGKLLSDAESGSEWETDEEGFKTNADGPVEANGSVDVEEMLETGPISYSSILKTTRKKGNLSIAAAKPVPKKDVNANPIIASGASLGNPEAGNSNAAGTTKKVKKKDPITYDLFSALQAKPPAGKKKATVLGSKIAPNQRVSGQRNVVSAAASSSSVPNKLDSTAPSKRRGKERENPKKKRKTILKKLILEARERRKLELERQRASPEPDLQEVIEAGEQVDEEDDEVGKEKKTAADDEMEEMKEASNEEGTTGATVEPAAGKTNLEMSKVDEDSPEFKARRELHSRKFRDYCNHMRSADLDEAVKALLADLIRFQDNQHAKDPVKAKARRRYVIGLREVKKFLKVKKVQLLIMAPDLERVEGAKGLNDFVQELLSLCDSHSIPYVFTMDRRRLGRACVRKVPVACVGIMNYQGSDENYKKIISLRSELQIQYDDKYQTILSRYLEAPSISRSSPPPSLSGSRLRESAPPFQPRSQADVIKNEFMNKIKEALVEN